jgi:LysM repeat protein
MLRLLSRTTLLLLCFIAYAPSARAQSNGYNEYIEQYWSMAVEQMQRYGIPASITLAQGIIETNAGRSMLSRKANNHFGIKCSNGWTGPYVLANDDRPNERFRAYGSAKESYEDHSRFLTRNQRYAFLFKLSPTDYRSWAYGLKSAGYATNPRYADLLIGLIEDYQLYRFDNSRDIKTRQVARIESFSEHRVYFNNDNYYIIARAGDTFKSIAKETGVSKRKLIKYNELPSDYVLSGGEVLYLEKKRSRAEDAYKGKLIVVQQGESLYSIAQRFGIRLKYLYRMNNLPADATAFPGQELFVNR